VATGLVKSFARPGGNLTGWASQFEDLITKQSQLMKEALPGLARIVLLARVESSAEFVGRAEAAARGLGLGVRSLKVGTVGEYDNAFKAAQRERAGGIQVLPSPIFSAQRRVLIQLAAKYRLPAIYEFRDYVDDGGLMSYGPSITAMFRGAAGHVDRILKGARPEDMPIERPATFELVVNLKTAKALGLTISPDVLGRADEVIK
jgi:putative ABC transport system substrate-binding protein